MTHFTLSTIHTAHISSSVARADAAVFRLINHGLASPLLDNVMLAASALGEDILQAGLGLLLILTGLLANRLYLRRAGYAGLVAFIFSGAVVQIAKHLWDRPRPLLVLHDVRLVGGPLFVHSFPSGHTCTACAVMFAVSVYLGKLRYVLIPLAVLTGISRVYLGVHFPLDVIFGGLAGAFIGVWSARLVGPRSQNKPLEEETEATVTAK